MKKLALGMILLIGGGLAWRAMHSDAPEPKLIFDRFWVDHMPPSRDEKFQLFFVNSDFPFGRFVVRTHWTGAFEVFHYHFIPNRDRASWTSCSVATARGSASVHGASLPRGRLRLLPRARRHVARREALLLEEPVGYRRDSAFEGRLAAPRRIAAGRSRRVDGVSRHDAVGSSAPRSPAWCSSSSACSRRIGRRGRWCATRARRGRSRCRCTASSGRRCARRSASRARGIASTPASTSSRIAARRWSPRPKGVVVRIGTTDRLGGNTVWVAGKPSTLYYYAHLDGFRPGLRVGDHVEARRPHRPRRQHGQRAHDAAASALRHVPAARAFWPVDPAPMLK